MSKPQYAFHKKPHSTFYNAYSSSNNKYVFSSAKYNSKNYSRSRSRSWSESRSRSRSRSRERSNNRSYASKTYQKPYHHDYKANKPFYKDSRFQKKFSSSRDRSNYPPHKFNYDVKAKKFGNDKPYGSKDIDDRQPSKRDDFDDEVDQYYRSKGSKGFTKGKENQKYLRTEHYDCEQKEASKTRDYRKGEETKRFSKGTSSQKQNVSDMNTLIENMNTETTSSSSNSSNTYSSSSSSSSTNSSNSLDQSSIYNSFNILSPSATIPSFDAGSNIDEYQKDRDTLPPLIIEKKKSYKAAEKHYGQEIEIKFQKVLTAQKSDKALKEEDSEFEMDSEEDEEGEITTGKVMKQSKDIEKTTLKNLPLRSVSRIQDPRKRLCNKLQPAEKLNLVLDLDETIINSAAVDGGFDIGELTHIPGEHIREIENEGDRRRILLVLRPYFKEFLMRMSKLYNIYAYSHGRWEYVQKLLEVIDKDGKYIRRDKIFKNTGQVDRSTQKMIAKLGLSEEEAEKTIIIDDQRYIWGEAQKKVVPSKKFIPLKDYMPEEKYLRYLLFNKVGALEKDAPWSLCSKSDPLLLHTYSEFNLKAQMSSQLEPLAHLLEEIHNEYNVRKVLNPREQEKYKVENLLQEKLKKVMRGWKVFIVSPSATRAKMFQDLAHTLGGVVVDQAQAQYMFVDSGIDVNQKQTITQLVNSQPLLTLISINWLLESFFSCKRIAFQKFYYKAVY